MSKHVYIDADDFSETDNSKFFGLSPNQPVCLRYGPVVKLVSIERNADGSVDHVKVELLPDHKEKLKGYIHWVSKDHSMTVTCNLYSLLFTTENLGKAGDKWRDFINPNSLVVKNNVKMWDLHRNAKVDDRF